MISQDLSIKERTTKERTMSRLNFNQFNFMMAMAFLSLCFCLSTKLPSGSSQEVLWLFISFSGAFLSLITLLRLFNPWPSLMAWSFFVLSPGFVFFADQSLHQSLSLFLDWVFFYLIWLSYKRFEKKFGHRDEKLPRILLFVALVSALCFSFGFNSLLAESLNPTSEYSLSFRPSVFFYELNWRYGWFAAFLALIGWARWHNLENRFFLATVFVATIISLLVWPFDKTLGSVANAEFRNLQLFLTLGIGMLFHLRKRKPLKRALFTGILLLHTSLAVAEIEGVVLKRILIQTILTPAERPLWACIQSELEPAKLPGAAKILTEMRIQVCTHGNDTSGFRGRLAEFILYWK